MTNCSTTAVSCPRGSKDGGCRVPSSNGEESGAAMARWIKLPSGDKKTVSSSCSVMVGHVASGGRAEKPLLNAGNAYHNFCVMRTYLPKVRGVAMNPVEHSHSGGNHQHIGHASTIGKNVDPGQQVGQFCVRRICHRRGQDVVGNVSSSHQPYMLCSLLPVVIEW